MMRSMMGKLTLLLALGVASTTAAASRAEAPAPSADVLRARHAAHADAIRSLEVTETVQVLFAGGDDHKRRSYERAFGPDEVDERMRVWEAKKQRLVRQRSVYDFDADSVRVEQTDLRDLDELADRFGIRKTGALMMSLDQTRTEIRTPARDLCVNRNETTVTRGAPDFLLEKRMTCMGIVPPELIDGRYPVEVARDTDSSVQVRGHYSDSEQLAFEIKLEPGPDLLVKHAIRYDREGRRVFEFSARDYHEVADGLRMPMHTETTRINHRIGEDGREHTEIRDVESVRVNPEVPEATFQAPPEKRVFDTRSLGIE